MSYLILFVGLVLGFVFIRAILLKDKENAVEAKEIVSSMSPGMQGLAQQLKSAMYNEPLDEIGNYSYKLELVSEKKPKKKSSKSKKKPSKKSKKKK